MIKENLISVAGNTENTDKIIAAQNIWLYKLHRLLKMLAESDI